MISVRSWLKRFFIIVPITLLVFVALLGVLTLTHTGLLGTLWVAQKFVPALSVGDSEGRLLTGFTLKDVSYVDESLATDLKLQEIGFHIGPSCLLDRSVCIDDLHIQGLDFKLAEIPATAPTEETEEETSSGPIFIPLPISISNVRIDDIHLDILDNQASWKTFHTGFYLQGSKLTIEPTQWQDILVKLAETSEPQDDEAQSKNVEQAKVETKTDSHPQEKTKILDVEKEVKEATKETTQQVAQEAKEEAKERVEAEVPLSEKPDIVLPEINLPLDIELKPFVIENFKLDGETPIHVERLSLAASVIKQDVNISEFKILMPQGDLDLVAKASLEGDFPIDLKTHLNVTDPMAPGQIVDLKLTGSVADLAVDLNLDGPAKAKLMAKAQPLKAILPFDIALTDVSASWPLVGEETDYQVAIESLKGTGNLEGYQLNLDGGVEGKAIPKVDLSLDADGTLEQIKLNELAINTLGGTIEGQAFTNWTTPIQWETALKIRDIQPNLQWPEIKGNINADIDTSGSLTEQGGWLVKLPILKVNGDFAGYPIDVDGSLEANDSDADGLFFVETPGLKIAHGINHVSLEGSLNKNWAMDLNINAPDLSKSVPGLQGKALGTLKLAGPQNTPEIDSDLNISGINWQKQTQVESVSLKGKIQPLPVPDGDLALLVKNIKTGGQIIDKVALDLGGGPESHQVVLDVASQDINSRLKITGSLQEKPTMKWSGALAEGWIDIAGSRWAIDHSAKLGFDVAKNNLYVQAHCWQQSPSQICVTKDINAGETGEANIAIKQFKFNKLKALIPDTLRLRGEVDATAYAKWDPKKAPEVKVNVDLPKGGFRQRGQKGIRIGWDQIELIANLANNKLDLNWLVDLTENGALQGKATIPDVRKENMTIQGQNTIQPIHLGFLQPVLGDDNKLEAQIQSDLTFNGPILQPQVNGKLEVVNMNLEGRAFPLDIKDSKVEADFTGYSMLLKSDLMTEDGKLAITGDANWADLENWRANLGVLADELYVEIPPMVRLRTNTDLKLELNPKLAKISGEVNIPYARIKVAQLPESAVSVSSDEVLLDEDLNPVAEDEGLPMLMEMAVAINIGDDVHVSAFGLESNLEGSLKVSQRNNAPFVLGDINMIDGTYASFGQDLIIQEGKINMNGPVDQPYVTIKAIRNPDSTEDDVVAGLYISGPADAPKAEVFSEPSMSQTNALSYLLRGRGVDDDTGGNTMATALIGLSLAKGNQTVGNVGEKIGIEDMQLGTAGTGDDAQVTVSGYIAPGLQVMYGMGIFDAVGEFTVRYELFKDFYVQAVTGVDSAVDALYQFEFDGWW